MKTRVAFLPALLALVLSVPLRADVSVGDKPKLSFKAVGGEKVDLAALKGKLVLVDFWATWCGPCMHEAGHMVRTQEQYGDKGLVIIGISLDDNQSDVTRVAKEKGFTWSQYFDGQGWHNAVSQAWGVDSIPRTFLIGPDGVVLWTGHPASMDEAIDDAFKNHPPQLVDPKTLAQAKSTLDQIDKLIEKKDTTAALKMLAKFPQAAKVDGATAKRLEDIDQKLSDAADAMLAEVDPLIDAKNYTEAASKLQDLVKSLAGTPVAAKARQKLNEMMNKPEAKAAIDAADKAKRSDEALAAAKKLQTDKKNEQAYYKYKSIVKDFANTPAAESAAVAVATYEKDEAFIKHINETAAAGKAKSILSMAESYKTSGKTDLAKKKYQEVIDQFPGTSFAETAKTELAKLNS